MCICVSHVVLVSWYLVGPVVSTACSTTSLFLFNTRANERLFAECADTVQLLVLSWSLAQESWSEPISASWNEHSRWSTNTSPSSASSVLLPAFTTPYSVELVSEEAAAHDVSIGSELGTPNSGVVLEILNYPGDEPACTNQNTLPLLTLSGGESVVHEGGVLHVDSGLVKFSEYQLAMPSIVLQSGASLTFESGGTWKYTRGTMFGSDRASETIAIDEGATVNLDGAENLIVCDSGYGSRFMQDLHITLHGDVNALDKELLSLVCSRVSIEIGRSASVSLLANSGVYFIDSVIELMDDAVVQINSLSYLVSTTLVLQDRAAVIILPSTISFQIGDYELSGDSSVELRGAQLEFLGSINMFGNSHLNASDVSSFGVLFGEVLLHDFASVVVERSTFTVSGSMHFHDDSKLLAIGQFGTVLGAERCMVMVDSRCRCRCGDETYVVTCSEENNFDCFGQCAHVACPGEDPECVGSCFLDACEQDCREEDQFTAIGELSLNDRSEAFILGGALDISGIFLLNDTAAMRVVSAVLRIDGGVLGLEKQASMTLNDTAASLHGVLHLTGSALLHAVDNSTVMLTGGNLCTTSVDAISCECRCAGKVEVHTCEELAQDQAQCALDCIDRLCHGDIECTDQCELPQCVTMCPTETIPIPGSLNASDATRMIFQSSTVIIADGSNLLLEDTVSLSLTFVSFTVERGVVELFDHVIYHGSNSLFLVNGNEEVSGMLTIHDNVQLLGSEFQHFSVNQGEVKMHGSSLISLNLASLSLTGGAFTMRDAARLSLQNAFLVVGSGKLLIQDDSLATVSVSEMFVKGIIVLEDFAHFEIDDSAANLQGELVANGSSILTSTLSGFNITGIAELGGDSEAYFESCVVNVISAVVCTGVELFESCTCDCLGGVHTQECAENNFDFGICAHDCAVSQCTGVDCVLECSLVECTPVCVGDFAATRGNMVLNERSTLTGVFTNFAVDGTVNMSDSAASTLFFSSFTVETGEFTVFGAASMTMFASLLGLSGGTISFTDNALLTLEQSHLTLTRGQLHLSGSSHCILMEATAHIDVFGGDTTGFVIVQHNAVLQLDRTSSLVVSGLLSITDSGRLFSSGQSSVAVEGFFVLQDFGSVSVVGSVWSLAGNFTTTDAGTFTATNSSFVIAPKFVCDGETTSTTCTCGICLDGPLAQRDCGEETAFECALSCVNDDLCGDVNASCLDCEISVTSECSAGECLGTLVSESPGMLSVGGQSHMRIVSSSIEMIDGSVSVVEEGSLSLSNTTFNILIGSDGKSIQTAMNVVGNLLVAGSAHAVVDNRSTMSIGGGVVLEDTSTGLVDGGSSLFVSGGDLDLRGTSTLIVSGNSLVEVQRGVVRWGDGAQMQLMEGSRLVDGDQVMAQGSISIPLGSEFSVASTGAVVFANEMHIESGSMGASGQLSNLGVMDFCEAEGGVNEVSTRNNGLMMLCSGGVYEFEDLSSGGELRFGGAEVVLRRTLLLDASSVASGSAMLRGDVRNEGVIGHSAEEHTLMHIDGSFEHESTAVYEPMILDPSKAAGEGFTSIEVSRDARLSGIVRICVADPGDDDTDHTLEVLRFEGREGEFSQVAFECSVRQRSILRKRGKREMRIVPVGYVGATAPVVAQRDLHTHNEVVDRTCSGSTEYTSRSFNVLLSGCGAPVDAEHWVYYFGVSMGLISVCIVFSIVFAVLVNSSKRIRKFILGAEAVRIAEARKHQRNAELGKPVESNPSI